jgi:hypothetical protein
MMPLLLRLLLWPRWPLYFWLCMLALPTSLLRAQQIQAVSDHSARPWS